MCRVGCHLHVNNMRNSNCFTLTKLPFFLRTPLRHYIDLILRKEKHTNWEFNIHFRVFRAAAIARGIIEHLA